MQTRREYLAERGLAKPPPSRGKFSRAGNDEIARAIASGVKFSDMVSTTPAQGSTTGPVEQTAVPVTRGVKHVGDYLCPSDFRWPEQEYKAVEVGGKTHSMRECCNNCRVSLVMCSCASPSIHGSIPVTIEKR